MKESERLSQRVIRAQHDGENASMETYERSAFILAEAVFEVARQIAITREEAQNGKSSPFDRK